MVHQGIDWEIWNRDLESLHGPPSEFRSTQSSADHEKFDATARIVAAALSILPKSTFRGFPIAVILPRIGSVRKLDKEDAIIAADEIDGGHISARCITDADPDQQGAVAFAEDQLAAVGGRGPAEGVLGFHVRLSFTL